MKVIWVRLTDGSRIQSYGAVSSGSRLPGPSNKDDAAYAEQSSVNHSYLVSGCVGKSVSPLYFPKIIQTIAPREIEVTSSLISVIWVGTVRFFRIPRVQLRYSSNHSISLRERERPMSDYPCTGTFLFGVVVAPGWNELGIF